MGMREADAAPRPAGRGAVADGGRAGVDAATVAAALGLACLLATMLIYSAAAMPFQRFDTLPAFVDVLGKALRAGAPLGVLSALACALGLGRFVSCAPVRVALACAYVAGNAWFCAMALAGAGPSWTFAPAGALIGLGCLGQALAWGRVLARYNLRQATGVVAAAAVVAALLGWLQLAVGPHAAVGVFMACTLACVLLAARLRKAGRPAAPAPEPGARVGAAGPAAGAESILGAEPASGAGSASDAPRASTLARARSFLDVALVPALGLAFFAMLMAVRGSLFFEDFPNYVAIQIVVALILLACMLVPSRVPLMRAVYRGLIPTLSVAVLAANYLSEALLGGTSVEITLVMTLYTVAALLTLSTLAGMAHAAEFSSDLVISLAVALFCFVTAVTQEACAELGATPSAVRVLIVVTSGIYAVGMILQALWRGLRIEGELPPGARPAEGAPAAAGAASADVVLAEGLDARCDALAREYGLTAREREILGYLARGHTGVFISDELLISPNTVRTHTHNIYRKLGVSGREDVLRLVRE